jgi:hypothetical protein
MLGLKLHRPRNWGFSQRIETTAALIVEGLIIGLKAAIKAHE